MNYAALLDEIRERVPAQVRATRDSVAIAAAVSDGRTRPTHREIGNGLVIETVGLDVGNTILDAVADSQDMRHVRPLLEQGRLSSSSHLVAHWLRGLAEAGAIPVESAEALIGLGREPAPVTEEDVRRACWSDAGEWLP